MLAGLFLIISLSGPGHGPGDGPVRVWLGRGGAISAGDHVRVYVQTAADGYVVVLHRRPDGSVRVLFPGNPATDPFTPAGTYEIRGADAAPALTAPARGTGVVLAAVSPDPLRFAEFVTGGDWNWAALSASWIGADAEGSLTDIVQRMLGDGSFNYDLVTYTVVAPQNYSLANTTEDTAGTTATTPVPSECVGCSYTVVENSVVLEQPFGGVLHHRHTGGFPNQRLAAAPQGATLALYHGNRATLPVGPQSSARPPALITITRPRREPASAAPTLPPIVIVQRARRRVATETPPEPVFTRPTAAVARAAAAVAAPRQFVAPRAVTVVPLPAPAASPTHAATTRATSRSIPVAPPAFHTAGWRH